MGKVRIDPFVFWTSIVVIVAATVLLVLNKGTAEPYYETSCGKAAEFKSSCETGV